VERISTLEALEVFGEDALPVLKDKLDSLERSLEFKRQVLKTHEELYKLKFGLFLKDTQVSFSKIDLVEPLFRSLNAKDLFRLNDEITQIETEYRRIKFALNSGRQWVETGKVDSLDVEGARRYPIEKLMTGKVKGNSKIKRALCPFHKEENPSFCIYTDTNNYYCFSCKEGGDVIDLCMKLKKMGFREAVEYLS
jgi:hypothetical protein